MLSVWVVICWSVGSSGNVGGGNFVHNGGSARSDACDVLQNDSPRTAIISDPEHIEEQPGPLAIKASPLSSDGQVLAWESGNDDIHDATPLVAVEGLHVRPDRRRINGSFFHKRDQLRSGWGFPFHVTDGSVLKSMVSESSADGFAEHADAGK